MKKLGILLLSFLFTVSVANTVFAAGGKVEIILDASGSMKAELDGKTRIEVAKDSISENLKEIGALDIALRVYGENFPSLATKKAQSCKDSELLVDFKANNAAAIETALKGVVTNGFTPMAYSLELAGKDLEKYPDGDHVIILLSDGEETCDGDPVAVAKSLIDKGINVNIHVIGFAVDAATRKQLEDIAEAGDGNYYNASNASELSASLETIAEEELVAADKDELTIAGEIRLSGGDSFTNGVPFPEEYFGKTFSLKEHLLRGTYEVFTVDVEAGDVLRVTAITGNKTIEELEDGNLVEDVGWQIYTGFKIFNSSIVKLEEVNDRGEYAQFVKEVKVEDDDRYIVAIGMDDGNGSANEYHIHKDNRFIVELIKPEKEVVAADDEEDVVVEEVAMTDLEVEEAEARMADLAEGVGFIVADEVGTAKSNKMLYIYIGGGVVALLLIGGLVFFLMRKKEVPVAPVAAQPQVQPQVPQVPTVPTVSQIPPAPQENSQINNQK